MQTTKGDVKQYKEAKCDIEYMIKMASTSRPT